ncbi:MAG: carboxypeptidase-like regulatory domain-containing protein [Candidatus Thermoplasmatota archaeon]
MNSKEKIWKEVIIISILVLLSVSTTIGAVEKETFEKIGDVSSMSISNNEENDATKGYYPSASRSDYGWVYGKITDEQGNHIYLACIILYRPTPSPNSSDRYNTRYVTYSDDAGDYRIVVAPGTYTMEVYKAGYLPYSSMTVSVEQSRGINIDVTMINTSASDKVQGYGWLKGVVYGVSTVNLMDDTSNIPESSKYPLKGARISVYPVNTASEYEVENTFTDGDGYYELKLEPGSYIVTASFGVKYQSKNVEIQEGQIHEIDFILETPERREIDASIIAKTLAGELNIQKKPDSIIHETVIYDQIIIQPHTLSKGHISIAISAVEHSPAKTVAINIDPEFFATLDKPFVVNYDGVSISPASNLSDVLNPDDDGLEPEYLLVIGKDSIQLLVSIPHFSEHIITITQIIEDLNTTNIILLYVITATILGIMFIGIGELRKRL